MTEDRSRIPGFYKLSLDERRALLRRRSDLTEADLAVLERGGMTAAEADHVVENVVGVFALPLGLGLNFRVNGTDYLVPMAVEEPSVIAAASNAAKMVREGSGFVAEADEPVMTAQVELLDVGDPAAAAARITREAPSLLQAASAVLPQLVQVGGGARDLEVRTGTHPARVVVHIHIDCRDAMGANMVNTVAEALAGRLAELAGGRAGLRILTNLARRRCVRVRAAVPARALATESIEGPLVAEAIASASRFAADDPYRAVTHNKGIMNGVDAVVIATGNDWRGIEAGAHAYAADGGRYRPLSTWAVEGGELHGQLEMPMPIATVGGTLQANAGAKLAHKILGIRSARTLGMVVASVGLASNLAALRALATDGINKGHMKLHARSVAFAGR